MPVPRWLTYGRGNLESGDPEIPSNLLGSTQAITIHAGLGSPDMRHEASDDSQADGFAEWRSDVPEMWRCVL